MQEAGLRSRSLRLSDADEYARTATAIDKDSGANGRYCVADILPEWQEPNFDLACSSLGLFTADEALAAFAILWATAEKPVRPWLRWGVHPDFIQHGLTETLFKWAEDRGREIVNRCPPGARVVMEAGTPRGYAFRESAFAAAGFVPNRCAYDMRLTMVTRPTIPALPGGFTFRRYRHEQDLPLLVELVRATFADHFGYVEQPFEKDMEEIRHWLNNHQHFDPSLVFFVEHPPSGDIAGFVLGLKEDPRYPGVGLIDMIGVRREYRRRGLARTMLFRSFADYWDFGIRTVSLSVDGDSLTNAVALYEGVGMHIHQSYMSYERVLREGIELATVALE